MVVFQIKQLWIISYPSTGGCIMEYWKHVAAFQPCNPIIKLTLEATLSQQQDAGIHDVLKNVRQYNCLFAGGTCSFILKSDDCEFLVTASALVAFICQEIASSNGVSWCSLYT
uniref:Uncharacterized protein n=2 Tax=Lactuca sativa TaxID=4236 RepID=A0A9R1VVN8_LACSA|nr:hypothetical protein LSAT_V11C400208260 [Lactuca sativa]KAJ0213395.1 hypothetical protein LSAT_V11C400208280 [Lactuca sativa]